MNKNKFHILVVDDEWDSPIVGAVIRTLELEGWQTSIIKLQVSDDVGRDFESETLYAIETIQPSGVLLDVRLGEYKDDQFKGLDNTRPNRLERLVFAKLRARHGGDLLFRFYFFVEIKP